MKKKNKKNKNAPPGTIFIDGVGYVDARQWVMKSYYYRVTVPQDINAGSTIGLFCGYIGNQEWTNFTRPRMLPVGHEAMVYRVSLVARPGEKTLLIDVMRALQHGYLTIRTAPGDFISEPLSFFAVNLFGEMSSREKDPLARLASEVALAKNDKGEFTAEAERIMQKISGIEIPLWLGESDSIDGDLDLEKELYGMNPFDLYVLLHTITSKPLR